jgi:hypothetical protein
VLHSLERLCHSAIAVALVAGCRRSADGDGVSLVGISMKSSSIAHV